MTACSMTDERAQRGTVRACGQPATHSVQDRRPLPDGTLRPPMPACERHALYLLDANPTAYMVTFNLWAVR